MSFIPIILPLPQLHRGCGRGLSAEEMAEVDREFALMMLSLFGPLIFLGLVAVAYTSGDHAGERAAWNEALAAGQAHTEAYQYRYKSNTYTGRRLVLGPPPAEAP